MKYLLFFIFLLFATHSKAQQNEFKYQGEMPKFNYGIHYNNNILAPVIRTDSTDSVLERNRIYIIANTSEGLLLNSHSVDIFNFAESFHYVISNPDKLEHLPKSPEKAVIFIKGILSWNINEGVNYSYQRYAYIPELIQSVIIEYYYKKPVPKLNKTFSELTLSQQEALEIDIFRQIILLDLVESVEEGIKVKLPPPPQNEEETPTIKIRKRNIYRVVVNANNEILVRGKTMKLKDVKENAKKFISNYGEDPELSVSPKNAIISLQNDLGTDANIYIAVYKELKAAYYELWEEEAQKRFSTPYEELDEEQRKAIKTEIPLVLSEAEPTNFGK